MSLDVSVIVPIFNTEKYLDRCINSLLKQQHKSMEIILVNDGSTDNSPQLCDEYASLYSNIKVFHKPNGGLSSARNAGLREARGKYVSFIDSDDYITENMMGDMFSIAKNELAEIVVTGRIDVYGESESYSKAFNCNEEKKYSKEDAICCLLTRKEIDVSVCDKIFLRNLFNDVEFPEGESNEDLAVIFQLIDKCQKIVHTKTADYYYFHRENSISQSMDIKAINILMKNVRNVVNFINCKYNNHNSKALFFQGYWFMVAYHNVMKKVASTGQIKEKENEIIKEINRFIIPNYYKLIRFKYGDIIIKTQLFLCKYNLYLYIIKMIHKFTSKKK